jgi:S1-C subfamily serine protease
MVSSRTHLITDLRPYLVRVLTVDERKVNGTGFLCHPDGYVLTCRHVIEQHLERGSATVGLQLYGNELQQASICEQLGSADADIAVLKITEQAGPRCYLSLDTRWRVNRKDDLESFGYPAGPFKEGVSIRGQVGGLTPTLIKDVEVLPIIGLNVVNVDGGYSGAPVLNTATQRVIGLVYAAERKETQAFFTPIGNFFGIRAS